MSLEHGFNALTAQYELLVVKEDELHKQSKTCSDVIEKAIQGLLAHGNEYDCMTVEALLMALQEVQERVLVELSRTRIQKGLYAFMMMQVRHEQD